MGLFSFYFILLGELLWLYVMFPKDTYEQYDECSYLTFTLNYITCTS